MIWPWTRGGLPKMSSARMQDRSDNKDNNIKGPTCCRIDSSPELHACQDLQGDSFP